MSRTRNVGWPGVLGVAPGLLLGRPRAATGTGRGPRRRSPAPSHGSTSANRVERREVLVAAPGEAEQDEHLVGPASRRPAARRRPGAWAVPRSRGPSRARAGCPRSGSSPSSRPRPRGRSRRRPRSGRPRRARRAAARSPGSRARPTRECASTTWPSASWSISEREPWRMPGVPPRIAAAWRPVSMPSPAASATASRTAGSPMNRASSPIAFEPPPTQARARSGRRPSTAVELGRRLVADPALEVADDRRVRVRPHRRAEDVVGRLDVGDPVAHRLVDRVLERRRAGGDASGPRRRGRASAGRSGPGARCPRRPCRRRTAGRAARRPSRSRRRAGRRRSRR